VAPFPIESRQSDVDIRSILAELYAELHEVKKTIEALEQLTASSGPQQRRSPRRKRRLSDEDVSGIRAAPASGEPGGKTLAEIAADYGVSASYIAAIRSRALPPRAHLD